MSRKGIVVTGEYWVSGTQATGWVKVKDKIVIDTCPIFKKFVGQDFSNLTDWLKDVKWRRLNESEVYCSCEKPVWIPENLEHCARCKGLLPETKDAH